MVWKSYCHERAIQNRPKKHVLLCQEDMLTQLQTIFRHMLTKTEVPEDTKMGIETEFEIKVFEHKE